MTPHTFFLADMEQLNVLVEAENKRRWYSYWIKQLFPILWLLAREVWKSQNIVYLVKVKKKKKLHCFLNVFVMQESLHPIFFSEWT